MIVNKTLSYSSKKILIIIDNLGIGGVQEHILNFVKNLPKYDVTIISVFGEDDYKIRLNEAKANVVFLCKLKGSAIYKMFFLPYLLIKFAKLNSKIKSNYDWINIRLPLSLFLFSFFKMYKTTNCHFNVDSDIRQLCWYEKWLFRLYLKKYTSISISKPIRQGYSHLVADIEKIKDDFAFVSERFSFSPHIYKKRLNILFVARLIPEKGLISALNIINEYNKKFSNKINLHVFGDGPELTFVKQTYLDESLDYVKFYGFVSNIDDYYINADGLIKTSFGEPANSVVREFLLMGKLVFSSIETKSDFDLATKGLIVELKRDDLEFSIKQINEKLANLATINKEYIKNESSLIFGNKLVKEFYIKLIEDGSCKIHTHL